MITAGFACVLLLVLCTLIHYEMLGFLKFSLARTAAIPRRAKLIVVILGSMGSHFLQITLFAAAYFVLRDRFGLGTFGGEFNDSFFSFMYYSAETYTSLGFGDIFPIGAIRMFTGIEALTGLVMIGWTASFTYLEMTRYWADP
jgi:hypothetical protein